VFAEKYMYVQAIDCLKKYTPIQYEMWFQLHWRKFLPIFFLITAIPKRSGVRRCGWPNITNIRRDAISNKQL